MRAIPLALALCLALAAASPVRADDTTATLPGVTPKQATLLLRALQGAGLRQAKQGGASVTTQWSVDKVEVDASGWLVHGALKARFSAFQHRQSSLLANVVSLFSGTRARKVEFAYAREVTIEYDAKSGLVGVRMHDTKPQVGEYNIAIEGTTSAKVQLPSVAVSGGPFRVQGAVEGQAYRAYATGLPYTLLPLVAIERHGFGSRKRLRVQFGLRWKSNVELEVRAHGSTSEDKAEADIDVTVGGEVVLSGAIATTNRRLTTPISVKATGQGLLASVLFDEASATPVAGLKLAMAMDVNWELAILQHAAVTNFGSVHMESKPPLPFNWRSKPVPPEVTAAWSAHEPEAGLPLPGGPPGLLIPSRAEPGLDLDAIRSLYRNVAVRKPGPKLTGGGHGAAGALEPAPPSD